MDETPTELEALQDLLDESHRRAGAHLRSIWEDSWRLSAQQLVDTLTGVRILALATTNAAGAPRVAPVDGIFHAGSFWFGTGAEAVRARHLRARPAVSASHNVGESLAVVVHGTARFVTHGTDEFARFARRCVAIYGHGWEEWSLDEGAVYARIEAHTMFGATPPPEVLEEMERRAAATDGG